MVFLVTLSTFSPSQERLPVKTVEIESRAVDRKLEYNIILPADYEQDPAHRYPVLYLLHGYGGNYTDWVRALGAPTYAAKIPLIFVMPDAGNSRYVNWSRSDDGRPNRWEDYIVEELIPHVDATYRTVAAREGRAITGLSMGGYGALTVGLRHPELFASIGSISGSLESSRRAAKRLREGGDRSPQLEPQDNSEPAVDIQGFSTQSERTPRGAVFSTVAEATAHDPFRLVTRVSKDLLPHIYLDCGTEDSLFEDSRQFAEVLLRNGVPFTYHQGVGAHDASYWIEALGRAVALQYEVLERERGRRPEVRRRAQ